MQLLTWPTFPRTVTASTVEYSTVVHLNTATKFAHILWDVIYDIAIMKILPNTQFVYFVADMPWYEIIWEEILSFLLRFRIFKMLFACSTQCHSDLQLPKKNEAVDRNAFLFEMPNHRTPSQLKLGRHLPCKFRKKTNFNYPSLFFAFIQYIVN